MGVRRKVREVGVGIVEAGVRVVKVGVEVGVVVIADTVQVAEVVAVATGEIEKSIAAGVVVGLDGKNESAVCEKRNGWKKWYYSNKKLQMCVSESVI